MSLANDLTRIDTDLRTATGFSADDGASLLMVFRGLQAESKEQGLAHAAVAKDLHTLVADPFEQWAQGHMVRSLLWLLLKVAHPIVGKVEASKEHSPGRLVAILRVFTGGCKCAELVSLTHLIARQVQGLKNFYLTKTRRADEAEDEYVILHSPSILFTVASAPVLLQTRQPTSTPALQN